MTAPALAPLGTELLDDPAADPATVSRSLHHIARANHWFGGRAAALWGVHQLVRDLPTTGVLTLFDLGTGAADLPLAAIDHFAQRGRTLRALALERSPVAAAIASERGVPTVIACAGQMPVRTASVDIVLVSQVAHHLAPDAVVDLFRAASALARVGVVVADLRRSEVAVAAFRIGSTLLGFDSVTRTDGVTSVRRGYRADELRRLAVRAGQTPRVRRRPGFRLVAVWKTA